MALNVDSIFLLSAEGILKLYFHEPIDIFWNDSQLKLHSGISKQIFLTDFTVNCICNFYKLFEQYWNDDAIRDLTDRVFNIDWTKAIYCTYICDYSQHNPGEVCWFGEIGENEATAYTDECHRWCRTNLYDVKPTEQQAIGTVIARHLYLYHILYLYL